MFYDKHNLTDWLPTTVKEAKQIGWTTPDVVLFTGDAYIDHPSFGAAIIGRILQKLGLKVAIVPQPNWQDDWRDFKKFGMPNLFFAVTSGSMDSMVNHYTASKRRRSDDAYTPGSEAGKRPDYATTVYSKILKALFPETPVIIGGIEASLRRFTHYDYWDNKLFPSILHSSGADLLAYGMGEKTIKTIVEQLRDNVPFCELKNIPQTAYLVDNKHQIPTNKWGLVELASHENCKKSKPEFANNFKTIEQETIQYDRNRLIQMSENQIVVVNPAFTPITTKELDAIYDLPFTRLPHPKYIKKKPIPAYEMVRHSVTIHRGCFGACAFCTIAAHQGKRIISRSENSILAEVKTVTQMPDFKGYISDLGGPSANMYKMQGKNLTLCEKCDRPSCIFPKLCKNLSVNHQSLIDLYKKATKVAQVKKISIGSGVRYDLLFDNKNKLTTDGRKYTEQLVRHHVSGRLKVAPEHSSVAVLSAMRKTSFALFYEFKKVFEDLNNSLKLNQQLIPYFISSHPGCSTSDMAELAIETKRMNFRLEQIQDFTPTPATLSTTMFYAGINPYSGKKVKTPTSKEAKEKQRMFFFWYDPKYRHAISRELQSIGKSNLLEQLLNKKVRKKK